MRVWLTRYTCQQRETTPHIFITPLTTTVFTNKPPPPAGISTLSGCGSPEQLERLPELPASEERRLRRAATLLQQRLVLRQWLVTHRLQHAYSRSVRH